MSPMSSTHLLKLEQIPSSPLSDLEDESTEHLMTLFYSRLALHQRKVDALRSAQLDLLNQGLSPYFWAGVQIVGGPIRNTLTKRGHPMTISRSQRETILAKIQRLVAEKYFDPNFDDSGWNGIVEHHRNTILEADSEGGFEKAVATMLAEMAPSPLALLSDRTLITPPNAINASFSVRTIGDQPHWVFKDVLPGGVAARAGIKAGDVLLSIGGKPVSPSLSDGAAAPNFEMQRDFPVMYSAEVRRELTISLKTARRNTKTILTLSQPRSRPELRPATSLIFE